MKETKIIEIKDEVTIGEVILEKGDRIKVLKEGIGIPPILNYQAEYKDKLSGAVIEFDSAGFVVETPSGELVTFEYKNMIDIGLF